MKIKVVGYDKEVKNTQTYSTISAKFKNSLKEY